MCVLKELCQISKEPRFKTKDLGIVRSNSNDIDIPVILLANEMPNLFVYVDNGAGKNRKELNLSSCSLSKDQKETLLAFLHSLEMIMCHRFYEKGDKYAGN